MAIVRIAHCTARSVGGADVTTGAVPINTTGADFLVAIANGYDPLATWALGDLVDSKGNTWTMRTATTIATGASNLQVWDCVPTSVGANHTFTLSAANVTFASICVAAYSGVHQTSRFDQQIRNNAGTGTTVQPGSLTPAASGELILFAAGTISPPGTVTVDSGFSMLDDQPFSSGNAMGSALAEKIKTDAVAENPTFTDTTSQDNFIVTLIAYKAAAASSTSVALTGVAATATAGAILIPGQVVIASALAGVVGTGSPRPFSMAPVFAQVPHPANSDSRFASPLAANSDKSFLADLPANSDAT